MRRFHAREHAREAASDAAGCGVPKGGGAAPFGPPELGRLRAKAAAEGGARCGGDREREEGSGGYREVQELTLVT